ncbi:MAG: DUF962 domain-containing protein [Acidobacteriota bacterium]|nr:DUF962 domain-containing protein [Blastocatellia bacterium]MDW8413301.1 DUF962 domain-containing protein [Acidobacteriota bacterium]
MSNKENKYSSFAEFWPFYVGEHSRSATRTLHFIGTTLGILLLATAVATKLWYLLVLVPVVSYGFAWYSHFFVERNRPATFKYPLYSLLADFKMYYLILKGDMNSEVERILQKQKISD